MSGKHSFLFQLILSNHEKEVLCKVQKSFERIVVKVCCWKKAKYNFNQGIRQDGEDLDESYINALEGRQNFVRPRNHVTKQC